MYVIKIYIPGPGGSRTRIFAVENDEYCVKSGVEIGGKKNNLNSNFNRAMYSTSLYCDVGYYNNKGASNFKC